MKHITFNLPRRAIRIATFLLLPLCALAQPRTNTNPELRFLFLDETKGSYYLKSSDGNQYQKNSQEGDYRLLSSKPYTISTAITPSPGEKLDVYKDLPDPENPGSIKRTRIGGMTVPTNMTSALLVFQPVKPSSPNAVKLDYQVQLYADDMTKFPEKSIRVLNLSGVDLACEFAQKRVLLSPGDTTTVTPKTDQKNRLLYKIAAKESGGWKLLDNGIMLLKPSERLTGVLVYSPTGMRFTYSEQEMKMFGEPEPGNFWLTYSEQ